MGELCAGNHREADGGLFAQGGSGGLAGGGILWDWLGECIWLSVVDLELEGGKVMKIREAGSPDTSSRQRLWLGFQAGCCNGSKLSSPTWSGHRPLVHSVSHKVLCFLNIETNCRSVGGLIVLYFIASSHPVLKSSQEFTQSKEARPRASRWFSDSGAHSQRAADLSKFPVRGLNPRPLKQNL